MWILITSVPCGVAAVLHNTDIEPVPCQLAKPTLLGSSPSRNKNGCAIKRKRVGFGTAIPVPVSRLSGLR